MINITSSTPKKHYLFQWDNSYNALDIVYETDETQLKMSAELKPYNTDIRTKRCNIMNIKIVPVKLENINSLSEDSKKFIYENTCSVLNEAVKKSFIHFDTGKDYLRFVSNYLTEKGLNEGEWFPFPG